MDAVAELEELMDREAWSAEDCRRLQRLLSGVREPVRRLREWQAKASAENPEPTGAAAVKMGIVRYLLCQFNEALGLLTKGTDNKERRYYQALCHKHLRQWPQALENLARAEDRGWDPREINLATAEVQCLAGDVEAASRTIARFARSSADVPDWHYVSGLIAEMRGEYESAVDCYETARRLQPAHPEATFRLAYYYDLHGNEEIAVELYRECLSGAEGAGGRPERRPVYANALLNLAVLYEDAGKYDAAARCLRRVLSANPNHARARLFLRDVLASKTMVFDEEEAKRVARRNDLLAIPVTDFELSVRARNCLKKMNIRTLGDLLRVTEADLLSYKNFGETSLAEIKSMLASKGLRLGQLLEEEGSRPQKLGSDPTVSVGNEGVLATPIAQIEFSVRARKALESLNIVTLGDLAAKTEPELLACRNFGQTSLNEVRQRLAEYGLRLRETS